MRRRGRYSHIRHRVVWGSCGETVALARRSIQERLQSTSLSRDEVQTNQTECHPVMVAVLITRPANAGYECEAHLFVQVQGRRGVVTGATAQGVVSDEIYRHFSTVPHCEICQSVRNIRHS